jgi:hypothetical protein
MIKKIKSIKNLGVFNDYKIGGDLRDFNDKNIIYGWNYSGKTTLSKLFSFLDKDNPIDSEFLSVEFEVELTDSPIKITQNNRASSPLSVKVFNSDFIRNNLRFDSDDKKIKGITFDVGEGGEIRSKIKANEDFIAKGESLQQNNRTNIDKFNEFDNKFTQEAKRIKNDGFNSLIEFDKRHLKNVISSLSNSLETYTTIEEIKLSEIKANALTQNPKQDIIIQIPDLQYENLLAEVKILLAAEPTRANDDPILSVHLDLYNWVKQGYDVYQTKNPPITKCAFCGKDIDTSRFDYLNAFYTNEAAKLKTKISEISSRINAEKQKAENLEWSKKSPNDLIDSCQQEFSTLVIEYQIISTNYISLLNILLSKLEDKNTNRLFIKTDIGDIDNTANTKIVEWITNVQKIFEKHNETIGQFETIRNKARKFRNCPF